MVDRANIRGLPHLINATVRMPFTDHPSSISRLILAQIVVSVLSIGLSCVYGGSRTLTALAETGYAPRIFTYVDKSCVLCLCITSIPDLTKQQWPPALVPDCNPRMGSDCLRE